MTQDRENIKALENIHSTAFAAINQIAYWKKWNDRGNIDSLKIAFECILEICENNIPKESIEDSEGINL